MEFEDILTDEELSDEEVDLMSDNFIKTIDALTIIDSKFDHLRNNVNDSKEKSSIFVGENDFDEISSSALDIKNENNILNLKEKLRVFINIPREKASPIIICNYDDDDDETPISIQYLRTILEQESYLIPVLILNCKNSYENMLLSVTGALQNSEIEVIIKLLYKASESCVNVYGITEMLLMTVQSQFAGAIKKLLNKNRQTAIEYLFYLGSILNKFLLMVNREHFSNIVPLAIVCFQASQGLTSVEYCEAIAELKKNFYEILTHLKVIMNSSNAGVQILDYRKRKDNVSNFQVIPKVEELTKKSRPLIRANVIKGGYRNSEEYIDVQFKLLREDFIRPFRESLQLYQQDNNTWYKKLDVRVYKDVQIHELDSQGSDYVYYFKLDLNRRAVDNGKIFMYGNIVCISRNNFKDMAVGTVEDTDRLRWKKMVGIKVPKSFGELNSTCVYTILESKSFFITYKHTLTALQKFQEVPLKSYIVHVVENNERPDYLKKKTEYEIASAICEDDLLEKSVRVRVLRPLQRWPTSTILGFNESQLRAYYSALTRKVAIIQGPPGTGKTFVGLKIVKTLLQNRLEWTGKRNSNPILVVCYTNHALDQFLEGISEITDDIIRFGSRSKNENLKKFNIREKLYVRKTWYEIKKEKGTVTGILKDEYFNAKREVKKIKVELDIVKRRFKEIESGILHFETLFAYKVIPVKWVHFFNQNSLWYFLFGAFVEDNYLDPDLFSDTNFEDFFCGSFYSNDFQNNSEEYSYGYEYSNFITNNYYNNQYENYYHWFWENRYESDRNTKVIDYKVKITYERTISGISEAIKDIEFYTDNNRLRRNDFFVYQMHKNFLTLEKTVIETCLKFRDIPENCQILESKSVLLLSFKNRWTLHNYWRNQILDKLTAAKLHLELQLKKALLRSETARELAYLGEIQSADVIGMTTTGAASFSKLLHDLGPSIVVVEEAAEILESHVVTCLTDKCEHLILIGDHLQLRPKPNVYELETKYNMAVSLFERLVNNGIYYEMLEYQHRMKPEFSNLLVPTIYETYKDHASVFEFPKIRGIKPDLYFVDHEQLESKPIDDCESYENLHEAEFIMGLCLHLFYQGYSSEDITILAPYLGQFKLFQQLQLELQFKHCANVRVSTLDSYQGEESNIILLSLVRSNEKDIVGFMKIENRICVALSRARHGMYIIGNMKQMSKASSLWSKINEKLVKGQNIGDELVLRCENHPEIENRVKCLEQFEKVSPLGGCTKPCLSELPNCDHKCKYICHAFDRNHKKIKCKTLCDEICDEGHSYKRKCKDIDFICPKLVMKTLSCGHKQNVKCGEDISTIQCQEKVLVEFPDCPHDTEVVCGTDASRLKCYQACSILLKCGHKCRRDCHTLDDPEHNRYICPFPCERVLQNCKFGHKCKEICSAECEECYEKIDTKLNCGHIVKNVACCKAFLNILCGKDCEKILDCGHTCKKKCSVPCTNCETIVLKNIIGPCNHKVEMFCSDYPAPEKCTVTCNKLMKCSHRCSGLCGEKCSASNCNQLTSTKETCLKGGHKLVVPCYQNRSSPFSQGFDLTETENSKRVCHSACGSKLKCGHVCEIKCGHCFDGRVHGVCAQECNKSLPCGHTCSLKCIEKCESCSKCFPLIREKNCQRRIKETTHALVMAKFRMKGTKKIIQKLQREDDYLVTTSRSEVMSFLNEFIKSLDDLMQHELSSVDSPLILFKVRFWESVKNSRGILSEEEDLLLDLIESTTELDFISDQRREETFQELKRINFMFDLDKLKLEKRKAASQDLNKIISDIESVFLDDTTKCDSRVERRVRVLFRNADEIMRKIFEKK